eukprot:3430580-Pleurochrysis_carterae.AAC.1
MASPEPSSCPPERSEMAPAVASEPTSTHGISRGLSTSIVTAHSSAARPAWRRRAHPSGAVRARSCAAASAAQRARECAWVRAHGARARCASGRGRAPRVQCALRLPRLDPRPLWAPAGRAERGEDEAADVHREVHLEEERRRRERHQLDAAEPRKRDGERAGEGGGALRLGVAAAQPVQPETLEARHHAVRRDRLRGARARRRAAVRGRGGTQGFTVERGREGGDDAWAQQERDCLEQWLRRVRCEDGGRC